MVAAVAVEGPWVDGVRSWVGDSTRSCRFPSLEAIAAPIASVSAWPGTQRHRSVIPGGPGFSACPFKLLPEEPGGVTRGPREQRDSPAQGLPIPGPRCCGSWSPSQLLGGVRALHCSSPGTEVTQSLPPCLLSSLAAVPICLLHSSNQLSQGICFHFYFGGTCNGFRYLRPFCTFICFSELANWFFFPCGAGVSVR